MQLTPIEIQKRVERILLRVQKPGRYCGGELNQVIKDWSSVPVHIALAFPDIYDIGVPNLGLAIFYESINQREDALAERLYAPWVDMEEEMRKAKIPLFSLETAHCAADFDLLAFTLPYESLYTNTLNMLELAGIPLLASERNENDPLIIAGGHACYNPEPVADFFDAFVIGEGEEVFHEIIDALKAWHSSGAARPVLLETLAHIPGVYVPSFYQPEYHPDGTIKQVKVTNPAAPKVVTKRIVPHLPEPPTHLIVPNIDVVHNRVSVEIMRGCTRGCRFCHAGMVSRPVRERSVSQVVAAVEAALDNSGFEEVALLSLSSSDYTHILELVEAVSQRFAGRHLTISLPSLRIESFSIDLLDKLKGSRQSGFTLAPEAATERMRNIINKPIESQQLLDTTADIYRRGWLKMKLYFMIGHPSETLEDVTAIVALCKSVLAQGRRIAGGRAGLNAGVSTFIPKAHTPFQWVSVDSMEQIEAKQDLLRKQMIGGNLKLSWNDPKTTMLEAWLSRGDRRMGQVILNAYRNGAKFDAWQEHFRYDAWLKAFETVGLDPAFYTHRTRPIDEVFPWDHISAGVRKRYLLEEYQRSLKGELRQDCREECFSCGILPTFTSLRRKNPGPEWRCPEVPARAEKETVSS